MLTPLNLRRPLRSSGKLVCFMLVMLLGIVTHRSSSAQAVPASPALQDFGHLAPTPPMGWASWNHFFCDYDEKTIRAEGDALVSSGMRDAGYNYVVIQECIARRRDDQGRLLADTVRFPSGMPALVDYLHKLGLKAGIYTDIGKHTCYPNPQYQGSYGHESEDAQTFAAWGIDFVEMDYCNREDAHTGRFVYEKMAAAIKATGRPMLFYLCCWGNEQPWEWAQGKAQMWRTEFDISLEKNHVEWNRMVGNFRSNTAHAVFSGPESWNDADMLEIGNPGLNDTEAQAQFSMWAMSPSPLLAGADLIHMTPRTRAIYTNREVIAIDQDPLGAGAEKVSFAAPGVEVWQRPLGSRSGNTAAVMLLNASETAQAMHLSWKDLGFSGPASARDLWSHRDLPASAGYSATVSPHTAVLLRVHGTRSWKAGVTFEAETPSNQRFGNAQLFNCGECSSGYALALGGDRQAGAVSFDHIHADKADTYSLQIVYVRNGLEDKIISVAVNGESSLPVKAIMRSWNTLTLPVSLHAGENNIRIGYGGILPFYLDKVDLSTQAPPQDAASH